IKLYKLKYQRVINYSVNTSYTIQYVHTTINHAKTQKGRDALIAFSYEAASEWKPQSTHKNAPRLWRRCIAKYTVD
ncbi:MAG: hypothetical protein UFD09_05745, partial [Prevotella sp.]|nr:hypothetical protein [Prevotella sp.]